MSLTREQCSSFLGRLSSLILQIVLSVLREERDLGQARKLDELVLSGRFLVFIFFRFLYLSFRMLKN